MQPPTFREIIALLKRDGFVKVAQVGSHALSMFLVTVLSP